MDPFTATDLMMAVNIFISFLEKKLFYDPTGLIKL